MRRPFRPRIIQSSISSDVLIKQLCSDFEVGEAKTTMLLRAAGISVEKGILTEDLPLCRQILSCGLLKFGLYEKDDAFTKNLDEQLKGFDEIYVDTAPLIHEDWFFYFLANVLPILRKRRKKLVILEKTLEELHGLKNNDEKTREVKIRATILPGTIERLRRKNLIRILDTGSNGIADDHLIELFEQRAVKHNILLITQDRGLSERVVRLENQLSENFSIPHRSLWYKFTHRGEDLDFIKRKLEVSKLIDDGSLKRLYICPSCQESYYDNLGEYPGYVLCTGCVMAHEAYKKEESEAEKKRREIEEAKAQIRREEIEKINEERESLRKPVTVASTISCRRKRRLIIVLILCVIFAVFFVLHQ